MHGSEAAIRMQATTIGIARLALGVAKRSPSDLPESLGKGPDVFLRIEVVTLLPYAKSFPD